MENILIQIIKLVCNRFNVSPDSLIKKLTELFKDKINTNNEVKEDKIEEPIKTAHSDDIAEHRKRVYITDAMFADTLLNQNSPEIENENIKDTGCNFMTLLAGVQIFTRVRFDAKIIEDIYSSSLAEFAITETCKVKKPYYVLCEALRKANRPDLKGFQVGKIDLDGTVTYWSDNHKAFAKYGHNFLAARGINAFNGPHFRYANMLRTILYDPFKMKNKDENNPSHPHWVPMKSDTDFLIYTIVER